MHQQPRVRGNTGPTREGVFAVPETGQERYCSIFQAYVTSLRLQWTWIVELSVALEEHLLNANAYYQVSRSD